MALLISNAILHIVSNDGTGTMLSDVELDVDSETCFEFVGRHVRRLINAPAAREATFRAESAVYTKVKAYQKGDMHFKEFSLWLARRLDDIMQENKDIPPGDLLICSFDQAKQRYIAIVKLPYTECYTHRVLEKGEDRETQLIKHRTVLPGTGSKVAEACLIPYDPMVLRVTEKQYMVEGEMRSYFSELFLECETEMSRKETSDLIREIVMETNDIHFAGDIDMEARIKQALVDQAPDDTENDALNLENAAKQAYGDKQEVVRHFVDRVKEVGLPHEVKLPKTYVQREFKVQRIKADNGIELKFPLELSQDPNAIQIVTNSDGSVSITLKNLRNINEAVQ